MTAETESPYGGFALIESAQGHPTSGFPFMEVLLYAGDIEEASEYEDSQGKSQFIVTMVTPDSVEAVDKWMNSTYTQGDWEIIQDSETSDGGKMLTV